MSAKSSPFIGVALILIGLAILFERYYGFDIYFLRSYGFVAIGAVGLWRGVQTQPRRFIWISSFILGLGLYFLPVEWGLNYIERGLTIAVIPLIAGGAFLVSYLLCGRRWKQLVYGGLIAGIGLFFLGYYLNLIPGEIFITIVDDYWPLALVMLGIAYLFYGWASARQRNVTSKSS